MAPSNHPISLSHCAQGNHEKVHEEVAAFLLDARARGFVGVKHDFHGSLEKDHGRIETRWHWSIENTLHWSLDVTFGEDQLRVRKRSRRRMGSLLPALPARVLMRLLCPEVFNSQISGARS